MLHAMKRFYVVCLMLFNMLFLLMSWLAEEILNLNGNIPGKTMVTLKNNKNTFKSQQSLYSVINTKENHLVGSFVKGGQKRYYNIND